MRRVCHICGKPYEYPSLDPTRISGLRRCADCYNLPKSAIVWKCTCGKEFKSRDDFYTHRREQRQAGHPCKDLVPPENPVTCPFCGKVINPSKNKDARVECIVSHRCPGIDKSEKIGYSLRRTLELLKRIERNASLTKRVVPIDPDKVFQLSWLLGVFEKHNIPEKVELFESQKSDNQILISPMLKTIFVFDNKIPKELKELFNILNWTIIENKWVDCILNPEEIENKIVNTIKNITVGNVKE